VVQQPASAAASAGPLSISSPEDSAEREAHAAAATVSAGGRMEGARETAPASTVHRVFGITLPTGVRALDPTEQPILASVFGASLDYSAIHLSDAVGGGGRPYTLAMSKTYQVINIGPSAYKTPGSNPSLLKHETTHCWQAQHHSDSGAYITNSLASQALAKAKGGSAYCYIPGKPFHEYGAEQIAEQVENGEAPIISHISSVAAGAVDPENVLSLLIPRWEKPGDPGVKC